MRTKVVTLKNREKLNLVSNLSTMITSGISILAAITSLSEDAQGNAKIILSSIHQDLLQGKRIHEAFAKFPKVFDNVSLNMIRAAETSGTLDVVLMDIRDQIKKDIALQRKVRSALAYPIMVGVVFIAILTLILIVVIPRVERVFTQLKVSIPLPTKILMGSSHLLTRYPLIVLLVVALLILGGIFGFRRYRPQIVRLFGKLPLVKRIVRDIDLWRFTRSLYLLLASGMTITSALELTEKIMVKPEIAHAIATTHQAVLTGKPLSYSFRQKRDIFPSSMIELVQAGEKTGTLDNSLKHISEYLDSDISDSIALLTSLLEPILLVVVAILVAILMIAIIGPIYGMIGSLGGASL